MEPEFEVQRTIVGLTAFLCLLKKTCWYHHSSCGYQRILDGLWRREMIGIGTKAKDAELGIMI